MRLLILTLSLITLAGCTVTRQAHVSEVDAATGIVRLVYDQLIKVEPAGVRFINHICIFQRFNAASTIQHPGKYCIRDINVRSLNRFHSASIINALFCSLAFWPCYATSHHPITLK